MSLSRDYRILTPAERSLWRHPMMWLSAAAIAATPLLYASVYLSSSYDPYGHLHDLPVAFVNLDHGTQTQGQQRNLGQQLSDTLHEDPAFTFITYPTEAQAQAAVRHGDVYFALTVPADFSRKALAGRSSEHGLLKVYVSEGANYFASRVAGTFATTLTDKLNTTLGERRWATVQQSLTDLRDATGKLRNGAQTLQTGTAKLHEGTTALSAGTARAAQGAEQLASGATQLASNVNRLTSGNMKLSQGLRQLAAAAPTPAQLAPLTTGAAKLTRGTQKLSTGLNALASGATQLATGTTQTNRGAQTLAQGNAQLATQLPKLAQGLQAITGGSEQLGSGTARLTQGAQQLATGNRQLAAALQSPPAQPAPPQLTQSAQQLTAGAAELATGLTTLQTGQASLSAQLQSAHTASAKAAGAAQQLGRGAATLATGTQALQVGATTLAQNTAQAAVGARSVATGATQLQTGLDRLVTGNEKLGSALGQITRQLPAPQDLTQLGAGATTLATKTGDLRQGVATIGNAARKLDQGAANLQAGATRLRDGLNTLYRQLPAPESDQGSDPAGLSASVKPAVQTFAAAPNNGTAFAPYFMALALWVGVTMTSFIFPYQQLPMSGSRTSQFARLLRKSTVPALLVTVQALGVVLGVHLLGIHYLHPEQVIATAALSSLAFLGLVLTLIFTLGAAGRLLAVILLVVQLAASGGSYPVETAPRAFQLIHNWAPVTQSVLAFRHAITGAYEGQYLKFMLYLLSMGIIAALLGLLGRRWEFVQDEDFKPLVSSPIVSAFQHQEPTQN